ncbi:hypothetical protein [Acinetobacter kyonggiensis]|uniref:CHAT domain-containing protein n=1 Tax=Acinetobacter kyonggiensis TaxID=595670 RepID=A0A1H3KP64_9GAMM|nr:hypothetical protein [Acinetobacter kyonggiensis]SDY53505.1 hypothetical protein SAMN05421643_11361 [Acinetobacter kyonggiensis]
MKILFVTSYDEQTSANLLIANNILDGDEVFICEKQANRESFYSRFPHLNNAYLMIMSHGDSCLVLDNNKEVIISLDDFDKFSNTKFFLWACNTSRILGEKISQNSNIWWGYNCPITAPINDEKYKDFYIRIFRIIKSRYVDGIDESTVHQILNEIKSICDEINQQLDNMIESGLVEIQDSMSIYSCFRNIWANLVVWLSPQNSIKHSEAPEGLLDI